MADYSNVSFKNNGKLKLLIIVGTRPEIIRLAAVINKTRKYFDVILAHTGQNYDYNLNGVFFHDLQLAEQSRAEQSRAEQSRATYIDIAKAIGIICVLIGHSFTADCIGILIYAFHMPLFFLVSGFLSKKKRSLADWMKKKKRTLLVPYFVSCAGIVIASIFFESLVTLLKDNKAVFILNIQKWVRAAFIGLGYHAELWQTSLPAIGPIWFLLALFWALLLLELYKRTKYPMACAIGVSFLSLALHHFFWLPWSIQEGMVASLFATVGYSISLEKVKQNRILVCCVAILYLLFCLFSGSHLDMVKCAFPYGPVDFVGAVCCVIAILMVSIRLQSHLMSRLLPMIGRNSIWILCIHTIEFDVFPWWILARICTMAKIGGLYETAQAILRIVMAICISMIAEKMRDMDHATTNLKNI